MWQILRVLTITKQHTFFTIFLRIAVSIRVETTFCFCKSTLNGSGSKEFVCNFWELCYDYASRRMNYSEKYIEVSQRSAFQDRAIY